MSSEADQIIGIYRRHAVSWARRRGSQRRGTRLPEKKWLDKFLALLPPGPSVLDIGCGSGEPIGRYLLETGCQLTGIDTSPELLEFAKKHSPDGVWIVSDMRDIRLDQKFHGILAWDSTFHLTHADQRQMFQVFEQITENGAALMFTSGPSHGVSIGELEGEPLYHASLDSGEYRSLLSDHGFEVVDHVVEDPECGLHTVWLASRSRP